MTLSTKAYHVLMENSVDDDLLEELAMQVYLDWRGVSQGYALDVIDEIRYRHLEPIIVLDDDNLVALAAFVEVKDQSPQNYIPDTFTPYYDSVFYVTYMAGNGKGGGGIILRELQQISEAEDSPLLVGAAAESPAFYDHMGFDQSDKDKHFWYWIPFSIWKEVEKTPEKIVA